MALCLAWKITLTLSISTPPLKSQHFSVFNPNPISLRSPLSFVFLFVQLKIMSMSLFFYSIVVVDGWVPTTFKLERALDHPTQLSQLRDRDVKRSTKLLQPRMVDFPVQGSFDLNIAGFHYAKIELGTPPKEYYILIDTGSDVTWLGCYPCNGCPISSGLQIPLEFYDPSRSSTASMISCSDPRCSLAAKSYSYNTGCSSSNNQCMYTITYMDRTETSGYYVYDVMRMNTPGAASQFSAYVSFGCSISEAGYLATQHNTVGGIFGLGPGGLSLITQLSSQGVTPGVFSHCLAGYKMGGGILVIGQISEPDMVYTPLVPSQPRYNVNLQRISVGGRTLPIDPSAFAVSDNRVGTIFDSGTTLAFLTEEAFHPFVDAITHSDLQPVQPLFSNETWCYLITSSVSGIFPIVTFEFAGGAILILRPQDYLLQQFSVDGTEKWCIGFHKSPIRGMTILGELVLKDKLVVYDLDCQRIGWRNHDCSSSLNVSSTSTSSCRKNTSVGTNGHRKSSSSPLRYKQLLMILIIAVSCYQNIEGMWT